MDYCTGLIFNKDLTKILLVKKNRGPERIKDKINTIGGKLEPGETATNGMIRECKEETGLDINNWNYFCSLESGREIIYFYYAIIDDIFSYKQIEDEEIRVYNIEFDQEIDDRANLWYQNHKRVANLDWIISMALNKHKNLDDTKVFVVKEVH